MPNAFSHDIVYSLRFPCSRPSLACPPPNTHTQIQGLALLVIMYIYSWFYFVCSLETLERDNVRLRMAAAILVSIPIGLGFDILWSQIVFGGQQPTPANLMIVPAFMGIAATVLLIVAIRRSQIVHDRRIRRGERPPTERIPGRSQSDSQDEEGGIVCPVKAHRKLTRENSLKAHRMGALWMCPHGLRHKECDECIALEGGGGGGDAPTDEEEGLGQGWMSNPMTPERLEKIGRTASGRNLRSRMEEMGGGGGDEGRMYSGDSSTSNPVSSERLEKIGRTASGRNLRSRMEKMGGGAGDEGGTANTNTSMRTVSEAEKRWEEV